MADLSEDPVRRRRLKWAAVGLVVILEVGALVYFSEVIFGIPPGPSVSFTFRTTTTPTRTSTRTTGTSTSTSHLPEQVVIKSAFIVDGTLTMVINNTGTIWTENLTVAGICTPDFAVCYSYQAVSGHVLTKTFALGPKGEYELKIADVCVVPELSCSLYHPVANYSYNYAITVSFVSGLPETLPVIAKAAETSPITDAFQGLWYKKASSIKLDAFLNNDSGSLTLRISIKSGLKLARFIADLYTRIGNGGYTDLLLYKGAGCSSTANCASGTVILTTPFSTTQTGIGTPIYPLPYLMTVRDLTASGTTYFAVWIPSLSN